MLTLGIDSGTQSTKAVVLDPASGRVLAEARAPHRLIDGLPVGHLEQHPADWIAALDAAVRSALAQVDRSAVGAIGVSGQQHGFVPLDASGAVIRPAKLWCDTSTTEECRLLTERLGGDETILARIGNRMLPGYTAPKILWLRRHEPENYRRLRRVLLPHDFLNFHLTGRATMEPGDASGTALFDVRRRSWSREAIAAIDPDLEAWLPAVQGSDEPAGILRPELAQAWGLRAGVLVSAGGGDNMMGAIGTGNVRPGVVTASFGTSGTVYAAAAAPVVDPRGEIAAFCDSTGAWLPLLCTMNVTGVTEAFREAFGLDHEALGREVAAVSPGAGGLVLVPYFEGERTPSVPDGTGVLVGLNRGTVQRGAWLRAAMEGVTLGLNFGLRRLQALGVTAAEIRVTGGGARSAVWRRIMADVFGQPVVAMVEDEGAALGAAIQAAWCHERQSRPAAPITEWTDRIVAVDPATRVEPDPAAVAIYGQLQELQDEAAAALRPVFARHRRWVADRLPGA